MFDKILGITKKQTLFIAIFTVVMIGLVDYAVGEMFSLFMLYVFPIFLVSWGCGQKAGLVIAVLSAAAWIGVDTVLNIEPHAGALVFQLISRIVLFSVMAIVFASYSGVYSQLKKMAYRDEKTGAYNLRAFLDLAEKEMSRAVRNEEQFVVVYFDMDHFKEVNDTYGHSKGDEILIFFVRVVQSQIRTIDLFARIGGDEFVALFVDTDIEKGHAIVSRIAKLFREAEEREAMNVTLSVGITSNKKEDVSIDEIIKRADYMMYQAKKLGKNQVFKDINS